MTTSLRSSTSTPGPVISNDMSSTMRNIPLVAFFILACSGCTIPTLTNPLVTPSDAKAFPKLHGVYRTTDCPDNIVHYAHVGPAGDDYPDGFLRIISVSQPKDSKTALDSESYVGFVEQIGLHYVLHIPLSKTLKHDDQRTIWNEKWDAKDVGGYMVVRFTAGPDGIEMSDLNDDFIAEQVASKNLNGRVTQKVVERNGVTEIRKRTITITADSQELREFFKRHIDGKLFNKPYWKFTRIK